MNTFKLSSVSFTALRDADRLRQKRTENGRCLSDVELHEMTTAGISDLMVDSVYENNLDEYECLIPQKRLRGIKRRMYTMHRVLRKRLENHGICP